MSAWRDNEGSLAGLYGIAGNEYAAWLLRRGHGELLALSPDDLRRPMKAPRCPSKTTRDVDWQNHRYIEVDTPCPFEMLYRPDGWACFYHETPVRVPLGMRLQEAPDLIDYGYGPETFKGFSPAQLVELASKEVDVVYRADAPGEKPTWRYEVRS